MCLLCFQTNKPPATEYQLIREKAASQKRDVECALTKFIAKTGETETLFSDDPYAYPCKCVATYVTHVGVSLSLCCLITPGLRKDIRCHDHAHFCGCKSPEQTSDHK